MTSSSIDIIQHSLNSSMGLPASFNGSLFVYTLALFCAFFTSCLCLTQMIHVIRDMIHLPAPLKNPINSFRLQTLFAYMTIFISITPDTLYLWTYNELSAEATLGVLLWDRIFDSVALIPLLLFTWVHIKTKNEISFQLVKEYSPLNFRFGGKNTLYYSSITATIFMLSLVVSLSK